MRLCMASCSATVAAISVVPSFNALSSTRLQKLASARAKAVPAVRPGLAAAAALDTTKAAMTPCLSCALLQLSLTAYLQCSGE